MRDAPKATATAEIQYLRVLVDVEKPVEEPQPPGPKSALERLVQVLNDFHGSIPIRSCDSRLRQRKVACVVRSREYTAPGKTDFKVCLKMGLARLRPLLP